jgi:hypothetical protein
VRASAEPGEPNHAGNTNIVSVWYKWTAPTNGSFIFDTTGSTFDTVLAVYTGTIVTNLTAVATNNDYAQLQTSQVFFSATPGTTYYIAVDGFGGAEGNYVLNWRRPAAPVFTVQQPDTNIVVGSSVSLKSVAVGDPAPAYQWKFNATNALSGATNSTLTLFNAQYNQAGNYTTIASNLAGTAASSAALLTVQSTYASTNSLWAYSSNQFGFHVAGLTGHWYSVQFTSNLSTNHVWVNSMSNIVSFDFTDTNASNYSQRFYRSVYAP